jgi:hypothetical protein
MLCSDQRLVLQGCGPAEGKSTKDKPGDIQQSPDIKQFETRQWSFSITCTFEADISRMTTTFQLLRYLFSPGILPEGSRKFGSYLKESNSRHNGRRHSSNPALFE